MGVTRVCGTYKDTIRVEIDGEERYEWLALTARNKGEGEKKD